MDTNATLEALLLANRQWAAGREPPPANVQPHAPLAALVCCAELGFQPERLFGLPVGSLFVLQGAGVVLGPSVLSGLAYATTQLDVRLVLIMAHTGCRMTEFLGGPGRDRPVEKDGHRTPTPSATVGATEAAEELLRHPEFASSFAELGVEVVPLIYDHASGCVRLPC
jgi:hypothetical protein